MIPLQLKAASLFLQEAKQQCATHVGSVCDCSVEELVELCGAFPPGHMNPPHGTHNVKGV